MIDPKQLVIVLKALLKAHGLKYKDLAIEFELSEPSIKRMINAGNLTLSQMQRLADMFGMSVVELLQKVENSTPKLKELTLEQETILVEDKRLLLIAFCAVNHWSINEIREVYNFTEAQCIHYLIKLHHMNLLELLPNNRIKLLVEHNFEWRKNGPIWHFLMQEGANSFFSQKTVKSEEQHGFVFGMLNAESIVRMHLEINKLCAIMAGLHSASIDKPIKDKRGMSMFVALKNWEPDSFTQLRVKPRV